VSGFLARQSSELPIGLSNRRIHRLSTKRSSVRNALIGADGTAISCCASSSVERPRHRCSARTASIGRNSAWFV
jgi:hypothetical protein